MKTTGTALALALATTAALAATPPALLNYQGVLRDSNDVPLSGSYDMVFTFWTAGEGGSPILVDSHLGRGTGAVVVTGGLFNVSLGGGGVTDGSGPGVYGSLAEVFRDHSEVWLEVTVGTDPPMTPRVRVVSSGFALNATYLEGRGAAAFLDTGTNTQVKTGQLVLDNGNAGQFGLDANGFVAGARFRDRDDPGYAFVGSGATGVAGYGLYPSGSGGFFQDTAYGGTAVCGIGGTGVLARGNFQGGEFDDTDQSGFARVAYGDTGIEAQGGQQGGHFTQVGPVTSQAFLASEGTGIRAIGQFGGGHFETSSNPPAFADLADAGVGVSGRGSLYGGEFTYGNHVIVDVLLAGEGFGINALGDEYAANFVNSSLNQSGGATIGQVNKGIEAWGNDWGGFFEDRDSGGKAFVGYGNRGIWGKGLFAGGTFSHPDDVTHWLDVSQIVGGTTYKVRGTGIVSFVQNHPYERDKVVVYAAPEGAEAAVYTRGSASLHRGVGRVALDPTFALVAHPDVGLTAHLTPRGERVVVAVESLSTTELVVRGPEGSGAAFDYIVYGLRVGYEQHAAVQPKEREALLPPPGAAAGFLAAHPELRDFTALERFKKMRVANGASDRLDLSGGSALAAAIDGDREAILAQAATTTEGGRSVGDLREMGPGRDGSDVLADPSAPPTMPEATRRSRPNPPDPGIGVTGRQSSAENSAVPVSGMVRSGDVLVLDSDRPGALRAARTPFDPAVAGCVVDPGEGVELAEGHALVGLSGIVTCRADATFGAIGVGDPLTTSENPGHAMRADGSAGGAILGKAVEPLAEGSGIIKVLVALR